MYDYKTEDQAQGKERLASCISEGDPAIVSGTTLVLPALFVARASAHKPLLCILESLSDTLSRAIHLDTLLTTDWGESTQCQCRPMLAAMS